MLRQQTAVKDVVSPTRARSNSPLETTIQLSAEQKTQHQEKIDAEGSTKVEKQERLLKAQTALAEARAQEGGSGGAKQSRTACERLSTAIDDTAGALGVQSGLGGVKTVSHGSVLGDAQFEEKDEEERSRTVSFSLRAASTRSLSFSGGYLRDECPDNGEGLDGGEGKRRAGCTMWYYREGLVARCGITAGVGMLLTSAIPSTSSVDIDMHSYYLGRFGPPPLSIRVEREAVTSFLTRFHGISTSDMRVLALAAALAGYSCYCTPATASAAAGARTCMSEGARDEQVEQVAVQVAVRCDTSTHRYTTLGLRGVLASPCSMLASVGLLLSVYKHLASAAMPVAPERSHWGPNLVPISLQVDRAAARSVKALLHASKTLSRADIRVLAVGAALVAYYIYCRDTLDTSSTAHADDTDTSACNSAAAAAQAAGSARAGAAGVDSAERAGRAEWEAREEMEEQLLGCFVGLSQLDAQGKGQSVLQECCRNAVRWLTSISAAAVRWEHAVPVQSVLQVQSVWEECDQQRPLELRSRKNSFSPSFSEELSRASTPVTPAPHPLSLSSLSLAPHASTRPTPPPSAAESVRQPQAGGGHGYATACASGGAGGGGAGVGWGKEEEDSCKMS